MSFTVITKPTQGKPTRKSLVDAIIDDLTYLNGRLTSDVALINGSFENDADSDGVPDNWTKTLFTGGTFLLDTTDQRHGAKAAKFTSPGGASNGGGYLHSDDFIPCSPNRLVEVLWELKSSAAGVSNRVEIYWYKADQTASATPSTSLYNSTSNPTSWTKMNNIAAPPSDARYMKIRVTGCHTASTTAGSTWFDNVQVRIAQFTIPTLELITAGVTWTAPAYVFKVRVRMWGGGAGGHATGGGGGGGGYSEFVQSVTPGTAYTVAVGAGGAVGNAGGNTTFDATTANGGSTGGASSGGAGGASTGTLSIAGGDGHYDSGTPAESWGGSAPNGGRGGATGGSAGAVPGGGGSRNAAGANGRIVLEY